MYVHTEKLGMKYFTSKLLQKDTTGALNSNIHCIHHQCDYRNMLTNKNLWFTIFTCC